MAIRFGTESGAQYIIDITGGRMVRVSGEMNPYMRLPNAEWHRIVYYTDLEVGKRVTFALGGTAYRVTTRITWVEEFDIEDFELEGDLTPLEREADYQARNNDKTNWPYTERENDGE